MAHVMMVAGQIDPAKLQSDAPPLTVEASSAMTWIIASVLIAGILAITFKTSKRNYLQKD